MPRTRQDKLRSKRKVPGGKELLEESSSIVRTSRRRCEWILVVENRASTSMNVYEGHNGSDQATDVHFSRDVRLTKYAWLPLDWYPHVVGDVWRSKLGCVRTDLPTTSFCVAHPMVGQWRDNIWHVFAQSSEQAPKLRNSPQTKAPSPEAT